MTLLAFLGQCAAVAFLATVVVAAVLYPILDGLFGHYETLTPSQRRALDRLKDLP